MQQGLDVPAPNLLDTHNPILVSDGTGHIPFFNFAMQYSVTRASRSPRRPARPWEEEISRSLQGQEAPAKHGRDARVTKLRCSVRSLFRIPEERSMRRSVLLSAVLVLTGAAWAEDASTLKLPAVLRDKIFSVLQENHSREENRLRAKDDFASDATERLVSEIDGLGRR